MHNSNSNGSRAASARGFMALFAMLAMGLGLMARPAEAAPFAYVANITDNTVSVIDTATNPPSVVATIPVGIAPSGVAVTPDGKHAYVTNFFASTVSVIDTATNTVVGHGPGGDNPGGVAVTPDGKHAYVTNFNANAVLGDRHGHQHGGGHGHGGDGPEGVAVTPDGKHAYVTNWHLQQLFR